MSSISASTKIGIGGLGLATALGIYVGMTYMLTAHGYRFDIGWYLTAITPFMWACIGVALAIAFSVVGAAAGIFVYSSIFSNFSIFILKLEITFLHNYLKIISRHKICKDTVNLIVFKMFTHLKLTLLIFLTE